MKLRGKPVLHVKECRYSNITMMAHNEYKQILCLRSTGGPRVGPGRHIFGELGVPHGTVTWPARLPPTLGSSPLNRDRVPASRDGIDGCVAPRHYKRKHRGEKLACPGAYFCSCSSGAAVATHNPFSVLSDEKDISGNRETPADCTRQRALRRKCKMIVKLLAVDQSLKPLSKRIPSRITCGSLRRVLRSMYPPELTVVQELSIKTAAKAEVQPCKHCEVLQCEQLDSWRSARLRPAVVDSDHLDRFGAALAANVPQGWNLRKVPYIPNGHATLDARRSEGGNWNAGSFSEDFRTELVYSSGKPRVVTLYSEFNVSILTPLHHSLYSFLKQKGWLLVGSPTQERLREMFSESIGTMWHSFDYESATDNIKTAYVQRAVDELIDKGDGLTYDELRCLRVLGTSVLDGSAASTGQPMGSPMSFPLLCLVNKTVVDMALTDLLIKGEISFKEWTSHRCLINGDDLLTKSTSSGDIVEGIRRHGASVGLVVNMSKTMSSPEYGEINSTVFSHCVEQKKTNVSSLWMRERVSDVLGFAHESTVTPKGFKMVVKGNVSRLARQKTKTFSPLPVSRKQICMSNGSIKDALRRGPVSQVPKARNLLPVCDEPEGFDLTVEEQNRAVVSAVSSVRRRRAYVGLHSEVRNLQRLAKDVRTEIQNDRISLWKILKAKKTTKRTTVLRCVALAWERKRWAEVLEADDAGEISLLPPSDSSMVNAMIDNLKMFRQKRSQLRVHLQAPPGGCPFSQGLGYVSLC